MTKRPDRNKRVKFISWLLVSSYLDKEGKRNGSAYSSENVWQRLFIAQWTKKQKRQEGELG